MAPQVATPTTAAPPPAPAKTPRPAPRRSFGLLGKLFFGALALALFVAAAPWIVAATPLRHQVLNWIVPELPTGTVVASAQFGWLSPVLMNGIIVKDDDGRPLFSAESITSTSNVLDLIKDPSRLGDFEIEKPVFNIVVGKSGSNLSPLAERLGKKPPKGGELAVGVKLKDGTVTVSNEEGAKLAELTEIQAAYSSAPGEDPNHKVNLDCKVTHPVPDGSVQLAGQFHFVPKTKESHGGELSATIKGFPLDVLQPALAEPMHLTALAGVTDVEFRTKLAPMEGGALSTEVDLRIPRLQLDALRAGSVAPIRWGNQAPIEFAVRGVVDVPKQLATFQSFGLNSELGNLRMKGSVSKWTSDLDCDLTGEVDYDLRLLLAQLRPDIQDQIHLEGLQIRNIVVKGPLKRLTVPGAGVATAAPQGVPAVPVSDSSPSPSGSLPPAPVPNVPVPGASPAAAGTELGEPAPLPGAKEDGIVRGPLPGESGVPDAAAPAVAALPEASPAAPVQISADLAWQSAVAFGVRSENGVLRVSTQNNVLIADPVNVPVGTGRFRARPEIPLDREPLMAYLGPGPVLEDVALTEEMCRTWLMYVSPLMSNATAVEGRFGLHMDSAVIPLNGPGQGLATGKLLMQEGRVGPGPIADEILRGVGTIVQVAGQRLDPEDMVWMNMPRQEIPFQMKDGRMTHGTMTFLVGGVIVTSQGSVGTVDRTLDLLIEFRLPEEWLNRGPILAALKGEKLQIKVGGTLDKPQVDNKPLLEFGKRAGIKAGVGAIFKILENRQRRRGGP